MARSAMPSPLKSPDITEAGQRSAMRAGVERDSTERRRSAEGGVTVDGQHRDGASVTERAIVGAPIVGHGQIQPAIAVEVTDGHGVGTGAHHDGAWRLEGSIAVTEHDRD